MTLTLKQKKFADEYIISGNATQSAIKAGYSEATAKVIGSENLQKPHIIEYIEEKIKELQNEKIADQIEVLEYLTSVMRGEQKDKTTIYKNTFEQEIIDIDAPTSQRIRAAELLGKRYRLFSDKVDLTIDIPTIISGDDKLED